MIGTLTVMVRKDILDRTGYFDPNLRSAEDHDLWIRIAKAGYQFGYLNEKLCTLPVIIRQFIEITGEV